MSVQFQKELLSRPGVQLYININGIDQDNITNSDDFQLTIYALNPDNSTHLFSQSLTYNESIDLFNYLKSISIIRDNTKANTAKFIEITKDLKGIISYIETLDSSLLKAILDKANENEKLKLLLDVLSESELQNLQASIKQASHQKALSNLKHLLELEETTTITDAIINYVNLKEYIAGQPEKIFQNWIEKNTWTLGVEYIQKHAARQIGINSESDLIMETTDGFIDLIELKRPKFHLFEYDKSHNSYYPSKELSKVIGQCMLYLKILDDYKVLLEKQHKFKLLRPRIKIIVGRSNTFTDEEFDTLRMLNSNLNHIQVITYDYLYHCGENIISYYIQSSTATN